MKRKIILRDSKLVERASEVMTQAMEEKDDSGESMLHEVLIRPYKSTRTLEQNAYLHKLLADIADYTGDDLESTKLQMKSELLEPLAKHKLSNGDYYVTYPSTANMNTKQLAAFCEAIEVWAMHNLGFVRNA